MARTPILSPKDFGNIKMPSCSPNFKTGSSKYIIKHDGKFHPIFRWEKAFKRKCAQLIEWWRLSSENKLIKIQGFII